jgi:hypothetical protein
MAILFTRQQGTALGGSAGLQFYDTAIISILGDGTSTVLNLHMTELPFSQKFSTIHPLKNVVVTFTDLGVITATVSTTGNIVTLTFAIAPPVPSTGPFSGQVDFQLFYTGS